MNKIMKLAVISSLMALGIATANAQSTNTNVVLNVTIALNGFTQADESNAAPVKITNKDIFNSLNASSNFNITVKSAKLVVVSSDTGGPSFFVREKDGTTITDTSLGGNMTISQSDEIVDKNGKRYSIITFNFDNGAGTDFSVSGFGTRKEGKVSGKGIGTLQGITTGVTATVAGTGHVNGQAAILRGNINASGAKAELVIVP